MSDLVAVNVPLYLIDRAGFTSHSVPGGMTGGVTAALHCILAPPPNTKTQLTRKIDHLSLL